MFFLPLAACYRPGAAAPAPTSPSPAEESTGREPEPTTLEEASAQFNRARAQLEGAGSSYGAAAPAPVAPSSAESTQTSQPPQKSEEPAANACAIPCRALASMRRAADAICRLAGNTDARCTDARQTLAANQQRLAGCPCGS